MHPRSLLWIGLLAAGGLWSPRPVRADPPLELTAATVIQGMLHRQQSLTTLQGAATVSIYHDPEVVKIEKARDPAPPADLHYTERGQERIAFWIDFPNHRWRIEVGESSSSGMNDWGFLTNYGLGERRKEIPVLVETCDGTTITLRDLLVDNPFVSPQTSRMDPTSASGGGKVLRELLWEYLLLDASGMDFNGYTLGGGEEIAGVQCRRLEGISAITKAHITMWVAPDHGFAMVRDMGVDAFVAKAKWGALIDRVATGLVQVGDGLWLPAETQVTRYGYTAKRDKALCDGETVQFADLVANQVIEDSLFQAVLPGGAFVASDVGKTRLMDDQFVMPQFDPAYVRPPWLAPED